MATCSAQALLTLGIAYVNLDLADYRALRLQLLWLIWGGTETAQQLLADAVANGFRDMAVGDQMALKLQLCCNWAGGA